MIDLLKKLLIYTLITINIINLNYRTDNYNYKRPKISVFLPIFNKELYLKQSIYSIQKQILKDIEIVAINDGSTDGSLKILKNLAKLDKRIKIVNNDRNHGLLYSRAMGILNSTGEYIMNLDPDDSLIDKKDLSSLYKMTKTKKYDIIIYLIKRIVVNKSDAEEFKYLDENQLNMSDDHITNKLIKREIFIKAYDEFKNEIFDYHWNYHEDNIWNLLVRKYGQSVGILNKYIYAYKRNIDSLNLKSGSSIDLKNRFDRLKKIQKMNSNLSINQLKYHLFNKFDNYTKIKNNEIKNLIFNVFINSLKAYKKNKYIYNLINFVMHKLSDNKIIIFYNQSNIKELKNNINLKELNYVIKSHKHIISLNINKTTNLHKLENYIFTNDILIFLDKTFFYDEFNEILKSYKNNKIITFINGKKNWNIYENYKSIKPI